MMMRMMMMMSEPYLAANPEGRFSREEAYLSLLMITSEDRNTS